MSLEKMWHNIFLDASNWFRDLTIFSSVIGSHYITAMWIVALLWLVRRCQLLLSRPRSELIDKLGLAEPVIPRIALDGLGDTWVSINWHYPSASTSRSRRPRVRKHIVLVDNNVYEFERDQRRAHIPNLKPGKAYKLTVQAVQTNGDNSILLSQNVNAASVNTSGPGPMSVNVSATNSNPNAVLGVSNPIYFRTVASATDAKPQLESMLKAEIPDFQKPELEKVKSLIAIQKEAMEVLSNLASTESQFLIKQKGLMDEYSSLNASRKIDEAQRTLIRVENKNLEDENHALEVQISKTKLQAAKIAKSSVDLKQETERIGELDNLQKESKAENEARLDELSRKVKELQTREMDLTAEMKRATQNSRNVESDGERAHTLIQNLKNIIPNASLEDKLAFLRSEEAESLGSDALARIEREIELDNRIEHEWARAQKALEQQYVDAYLHNSEQKLLQQQIQHQQTPKQQQLANAPVGTGPKDLLTSFGSSSNLSFMTPSATRTHPGHMPLAGSTPMPSLNLTSHQPLHSPASLTSIQSLSSMQGVYPNPAASMNSVSTSQYDPFSARQASVHSLAPSTRTDTISQNGEDGAISQSAADDLLPSNLFQDGLANTPKAPMEDTSSVLDGHSSTRSKTRDAPWLPWLTPHGKSPSNRRTTSLFFGNHADDEKDSDVSSVLEDKNDVLYSQSPVSGESGQTRSPSKGMGSRIFQKGGHRSGSFVRRLSIFSRKEMESKQDATES